MIRTEQITKKYKTLSGDALAIDHVNLHFSCNGLYMILGKSGCGKTTLLNILSGLDSLDEGHIYVDGIDISNSGEAELDDYRNLKMGVIFQEYNLISELTVLDNLRLVLEIQDWDEKSETTIQSMIGETLAKVGLKGYESRRINQLSGGERQRVAVARTLIKRPNIIFADEPTGNLDSKTSSVIFDLLCDIAKEYVVFVVTHDRDSAFRYGDAIIEMENGRVINVKQQSKSKQFSTCSLIYQRNEGQPENITLTHMQLGSFLAELIDHAEPKDIIRLSAIEKQEFDCNKPKNEANIVKKGIVKTTQTLPGSYRLRLAASFLVKKKLTLFLTIYVLSISLALFFGALTTSFYQRDKTMLMYLDEYRPDFLPVYITMSYQDSFCQTNTETITKGEYLSGLIETSLPQGTTKLEATYDNDFYTVDESDIGFAFGVTMLFAPESYSYFTYVEGEHPQKNNECLITDYLASELGVGVGDLITNQQQELRISGIIQTDYITYQLKAKLAYGSSSPYIDYYMRYRYNVVYCRTELLHDDMQKSNMRLLLPMSDFTAATKERSYRESKLYYDNAQKVDEEDLIVGRMPQANNEVLLSNSFLEERNLYDNVLEFEPFSGAFTDLNQTSFNHCFSMNLDLSSFFSEGVDVVGIVSNLESEDLDADVYVASEMWREISELYFDRYTAAVLYHVNAKDYASFLSALSHNSIRIDEPAFSQIYDFSDSLSSMRTFLYALLIVTIMLNGFMLTNFIQISIRSNKRNIGILRALGVPMSEVSHLFTIESWIVYISSVLLSVPLILVVQSIANQIYTQNLMENPYDIITWNWQAGLIVLSVGALISILALQMPLRKLRRLKPIELIRCTS